MIDAKRREVFTTGPARRRVRDELVVPGARSSATAPSAIATLFEARRRRRPARRRPAPPSAARLLAVLAERFGPADAVEPALPAAPDAVPAMTPSRSRSARSTLSDLDEIEEIERRAYPTPWSRSMFASELAKPTSICLGAFEGDRLVGYVIFSRYVDAWHVMNVAVEPDFQGRGMATRCSSGCSS